MRETLFRGKDKRGEWHYGDLVHNAFDGTSKVISIGIQKPNCYAVEVIPETVGQYVGLTDKNRAKMFNGDKLRAGTIESVIEWDNNGCMYVFWNEKRKQYQSLSYLRGYSKFEAIGTIHDNQEVQK